MAYGTLDEQGRYRLGTYGRDDGDILGDYRVAVESREEMPRGAGKQRRYSMVPAQQPKSLVPTVCRPGEIGF